MSQQNADADIAVIGMSGRFPKSRDPWRLEMLEKVEDALRAQGVTEPIEWK